MQRIRKLVFDLGTRLIINQLTGMSCLNAADNRLFGKTKMTAEDGDEFDMQVSRLASAPTFLRSLCKQRLTCGALKPILAKLFGRSLNGFPLADPIAAGNSILY